MLKILSEDLALILLKNKIIDIKDRDIYIYGLEIILSTIAITLTLISMGIIFRKLILTLVFISIFMLLRTYTGGYHAEKFSQCFFTSIGIYIFEIITTSLIAEKYKMILGIFFALVSTIIIFIFSPVENSNNPLTLEEKRKYKKKSRVIILAILTFILIGFYTNCIKAEITFMVSLTILSIGILTIIPVFERRKKYV